MPRPLQLAGRERLLGVVRERFTAAGPQPRVVVLHGLGGVGKTSVAVEYAHRFQHEYGLIWQVAAGDAATLTAEFAELASLLRVRELIDRSDPVAQVHAALAARPDQWLLVLDNVTAPESIRRSLPPAGRGHVLISTQYAHWPATQAVEVPVLEQAVASRFLQVSAQDTDTDTADALAAELGSLPLALEQAAAYIQATGGSLRRYLDLLRGQRVELLSRGRPWGYDKHVVSTWGLAFQELGRTDPQAITLLRLLACYAAEAIPIRLLLSGYERVREWGDAHVQRSIEALAVSPLAGDEAVAALRRHSLIGPPLEGRASIHRLVQAITVDQLPSAQRGHWRAAAAALLDAVLPEEPKQRHNWATFTTLLAHARATLPPESSGFQKAVAYLNASGDYATAMILQRQVLDSYLQRLGPDHPLTLTARSELARWTGRAGDPMGAAKQYAALLRTREQVLGNEHPETLTDQADLAYWTGQAGDPVTAREQLAALLTVQERVQGPEHPHTLTNRAHLARFTGRTGDAAAARDQYAALVPLRERALGPEHRHTLTSRAELAYWTGRAGDPAAARDQYAALLPLRERVQGPEHPSVLIARAELAFFTGQAGDPVAARDQLAALLPVQERVQGPEHPHTLATRSNLATWTGQAGDAVAARDQLAALLPLRQRVQGAEHPETLTDRADLARWTGRAGDPAAARNQLAALLPLRERVQGPDHPSTLATRENLLHWAKAADRSR